MRGRLVFLGTSAGVPTTDRSLASIALIWKGEVILFDAGEGTQHRMVRASISPLKVSKVLITHLHGDHVLGLPGLMMTMALMGRESPLSIYGPKGIDEFLGCLMPAIYEDPAGFLVKSHEMERSGLVLEEREYRIMASPSRHTIESWAFKFEEKERPGKFDEKSAKKLKIPPGPLRTALTRGTAITIGGRVIRPEEVVGPPRPGFKMVYTGDTAFSEELAEFSKGADVLIHEATFDSSKLESAEKVMHSVAADAARVAAMAQVKQLILTHVSARYQDSRFLLEEAKRTFRNVKVARDLMEHVID